MQFDIRRFDIYRKIPKDLTQPTNTGGTISIFCVIFIIFLLVSEFRGFINPSIESQLYVQNAAISKLNDSRIDVNLDISVNGTKCEYLGLDIQDDLGRHEVGHVEDTVKIPINEDESGCQMKVKFKINRVPGNFHVSTHASKAQPGKTDMRHTINSLLFGDDVGDHIINIPDSSFTSLNNETRFPIDTKVSYDYIMKIVPTIYEAIDGKALYPFQYTYAYREFYPSNKSGGNRVPAAIWFHYELNPITVKYKESKQPIYHFLTTICAIVGGTFTVAGIIDSLIFTGSKFFQKMQQGKLG